MFNEEITQYCSMCEEWAKRSEKDTKDYAELHNRYIKIEQILSEIQQKLKDYELKESFLQCQKAQNRFIKEQLSGVFNNYKGSEQQ